MAFSTLRISRTDAISRLKADPLCLLLSLRSKTNERHRTGGGTTDIQRIEDQLRSAFTGNAWHGPAVRELLADVTAEKAAARPLSNAHSIWEIVLHGIIQHDLYHAVQIAILKKA
jgi:hypothetical protein